MIIMNKRLLILISILSLFTGLAHSQGIPVAAIVDNRSVNVEHTAKLLQAKLNSALTYADVHSENERGLYLVGELVPTGEDVVDTGMKKIQIREYNLLLRIEQPLLDMMFGSMEIPLKGSGATNAKAAIDAIRKFSPTSSGIQSFIVGATHKADNYFVDNIDNIIDRAKMLAKSGDYDAGLALLWACPNISSIHSKVYSAMEQLYLSKQNKECADLITNAQTAYSLKRYEEAAALINEVDSESVCAEEATALAKQIGSEIRQTELREQQREDKERERQYQSMERERERDYKLERRRISAIENVATAYIKNRRNIYHYYVW